MKARELMSTNLVVVPPETPASAVAALLASRGISAVPVVDASGAPVGLVTEGDLIRRLADEIRNEVQDNMRLLPGEGVINLVGFFQALQKITMDIPERKVTALIGPSGCGKSTLLRVFNRIYALYPKQVASGEVDNVSQGGLCIGVSFQFEVRGCPGFERLAVRPHPVGQFELTQRLTCPSACQRAQSASAC